MNDDDFLKIENFFNSCKFGWVWIDILTTMGPTRLERRFREKLGKEVINHWSPSVPEGYLEVFTDPRIVIHWVIGEIDKIVTMSCVDSVDFDEIDKSMAASIIHNSVIRILSEKF